MKFKKIEGLPRRDGRVVLAQLGKAQVGEIPGPRRWIKKHSAET